MKPILFLMILFSLISCSRYHHIPRATKREQVLPKKEFALTGHEKKVILIDKEPSKSMVSQQDESVNEQLAVLDKAKEYSEIKKLNQIKKPNISKVTKANIGDNERYKKLGRSLLMEILAMLMGGFMLLTESLAGALLGGIILAIAAVAFQITLIILLVVFIIDVIKEIINKQKKTNPKSVKTKDQNSTSEDIENSEPVESPKEIKKRSKAKNKTSWMFVYLLISNVLVWIATKIKIAK